MSNGVNKCFFIGRLTRDPEARTFGTGGRMVSVGLAVTVSEKNKATGEWEDKPMFLDCKCFDKGSYTKTCDAILSYCHKGDLVHIECKLQIDKWDDRSTGLQRTAPKFIIEAIQFLSSPNRTAGAGTGGYGDRQTGQQQAPPPQDQPNDQGDAYVPPDTTSDGQASGEEIPF